MRAGRTGELIRSAIDSTSASRLLSERSAVVLERVARGGGATRWYYIEALDKLSALVDLLSPGSAVSFYFDGRVERRCFDDDFVDVVLDVVEGHGEAVVGVLSTDQLIIDVEFIAGLGDFTELFGAIVDGTVLFVGAFPARDDDGVDAVTIDLPDADGVVRRHPH